MRRLLILLPVGLALLCLTRGEQAISQQPSGPFDGTGPAPRVLPPGVVPVGRTETPTKAGPDAPAPETTSSTALPPRPANPYPITAEVGPWMICAATYMGPDGPELARQVCVELRTRHNMAAYIFNHADEERLKRREELEKLKKLYPGVPWRNRGVRIQDSCAVLVGGFKDFETASEALKTIKALPLPTLKLGEGKSAYDLVNLYEPDPETKKTVVKRAPLNPFSTALVVRNPTVPPPPKQQAKFDPFWKELNANEEYSLLRSSHNWTLVVKEYQGGAIVQQEAGKSSFLKMLGLGNQKPGEGLNAAAMQAHEVAKLLRNPNLGFDAYVLHTRDRSIVTVGGFKALNDEEMQRVQRQLSALKFGSGRSSGDPIGLMAVPIPMEIPKP